MSQIFQKSGSHLKILGARRLSKFPFCGPTNMKRQRMTVVRETWHPGLCTPALAGVRVQIGNRELQNAWRNVRYKYTEYQEDEGTRWRSWMRHYTTSRKVVGLIPDGVIGSFHWRNPSAALWPWGWLSLRHKWAPGIFPGGQRQPVRRADNLSTFMCRLLWNLGASTYWNPQSLSRPVVGLFSLYQEGASRDSKAVSRMHH